ncbi:MAG TPA: hypothetical protein DIU09_15990 [Hyphomonadaceae bacterium]|nr:hypothetical protein [Hyphomonadaceae bacterium]
MVITNAPPSNLETYAPPSGMPSDFFDEMDLAAYFSLIGYDPAAIEEMNANGSYRSEHDAYQANGGLQSQAEEAWRRSGQWASGAGFNDAGRELFLNNYIDRAYGVDPEAGTSRSAANMAQYLSMLEGALNAAWSNLQGSNDDTRKLNRETFDDLVSRIESIGINIRGIMNGSASGQSWRDAAEPTTERILVSQRISGFVLELPGGSDPYQSGGIDGFLNVGGPSGVNDNARSLGRINLLEHEKNGSHTISEHVGKSRAFLMSRMQPIEGPQATAFKTRHSTFSSLEAANALVSSTLATGTEISPNVFYKQFGTPTGTAAVRRNMVPFVAPQGRVDIETAFGVTVFVVRDPTMPNGIRIHTAYPSPPFSK